MRYRVAPARQDHHDRTVAEIAQEKAVALGRIGRKHERLWEQLCRMHREIGLLEGLAYELGRDRYRLLRAQVEEARWMLFVQREAVGLRNHQEIERVYRLPPSPRR